MIRVLIAGSSAVVRGGLEAVVRSSETLELAGSIGIGELRDGGPSEEMDVSLVAMPTPDGDALRMLSELECPAILLTDEPDSQSVTGNLRSVLRFDARPEEITAALQAVAEGLVVLHYQEAEPKPAPLAELEEPLTPREIEVLRMLSEGLSNKLIAHRMGISEHTVKFHMTQILGKLRAGSRTDAVMQGIRRGLILI